MNIDHANDHSSFKDRVYMSNFTKRLHYLLTQYNILIIHNEIALCILSAINVNKINKRDELEDLCDLASKKFR